MVYHRQTEFRVGQQKVLVLLVYVYYPVGYGRQFRKGYRLVIEKRAGAAGRGDYPAQDILFLSVSGRKLGLHYAVAGGITENGSIGPFA